VGPYRRFGGDKASWIFTTTDVIANAGVIVAAVLVRILGSNIPDLVVAVMIALVVLNGAIRILRLR
jgi:Co/Zn/Cd efflux system component